MCIYHHKLLSYRHLLARNYSNIPRCKRMDFQDVEVEESGNTPDFPEWLSAAPDFAHAFFQIKPNIAILQHRATATPNI